MRDIAIRIDKLGKQYKIGRRESYRSLRESLQNAAAASLKNILSSGAASRGDSEDYVWALRDVSFEVERGEVVGVIGANGAGKSTLLKIISRVTEPTEGRGEIRGRVGSLLEVGTGFHPELTGRENVYLNGAILGMQLAEIRRKFDEIVSFAGVEKFIDTPVKHYSSGMYMRLAFAVAAHLETEILLVDEVLAVGDAVFQLKCLNKMSEVSGSGKTVLFVSHNMEAIISLCGRGILLDGGRIVKTGSPTECIDQYLSMRRDQTAQMQSVSLRNHSGRTKHHNGPVRLVGLSMRDQHGKPTWSVCCGEPVDAVIEYELTDGASKQALMFAITISNMYNQRITTCRSHDTHVVPIRVDHSGEAICRIPRLPLAPGLYRLAVGCNTEAGPSDGVYDAAILEVTGTGFYTSGQVPPRSMGEVLFDHCWDIKPKPR